MKNLYKNVKQGLKQGAKRYTLPIVAGGLMTLGTYGCGNTEKELLPIGKKTKSIKYQETLNNLDSLENRADSLIYNATEDFNKGLKKGSLDSTTMTDGLSDLEKASEMYSRIRKRAEAWDIDKYQDSEMDKSAKNLMNDYDIILNQLDFGKAELEKKLEKQGYEVDVYNPHKDIEKKLENSLAVLVFGLGGLTVGTLIVQGVKSIKKSIKDKY